MSVKAIGLDDFGGLDVLHIVDPPESEPGPEGLRIRVSAAGVDPTDATFRTGGRARRLAGLPAPYVPGMDLAGTIDRVGDRVDARLRVGDKVIALVLPFTAARGACTTSIVADRRSVVHAPQGLTDAHAATVLLNATTATLALDALGLSSDRPLAITGASGAVGAFAIALAARRGLTVIADGRPGEEDDIRRLGADVVMLPRGAEFVAGLRLRYPDGAIGLVDAADLMDAVLPAIADGGSIASLKGWSGPTPRGIVLRAISSFGSVFDTPFLETVRGLAADGGLPLHVAQVLPAQQAADAHRRLAAGGLRGRLVLDMSTRGPASATDDGAPR